MIRKYCYLDILESARVPLPAVNTSTNTYLLPKSKVDNRPFMTFYFARRLPALSSRLTNVDAKQP